MKTYNALSKSFTDEVKTIMEGGGKSIDDAFIEVKSWEKLMDIFEKNAVKNIADLNTYTTNGMYSGLFADTTLQTLGGLQFTPGDTFLMVTVNGYAASAFGTPQLTQMLYLLPAKKESGDFSARMYMRTAYLDKDAEPKAWVFANWDRLAMASEISGGGGGSIEEYDTLIGLITSNTDNIAEVREAMITNISVNGDAEGVNIIAKTTLTQAGATLKIPNADVNSNKAGVVTGTEINALYELDSAAASITDIAIEKDAEKNRITFDSLGNIGTSQRSDIELTPATSELAGLMSAEDKIKLDSVESTANSALKTANTAKQTVDATKSELVSKINEKVDTSLYNNKISQLDSSIAEIKSATDKVATYDILGMIKVGNDFDISEDGLLTLYQKPSVITFNNNCDNKGANSSNIFEKGTVVNKVVLTWILNKTAKTVTVDNDDVTGTNSKTYDNLSLSNNKTYTLKFTDVRNASASATTSIYFRNKIYLGTSSMTENFDSDFIISLSNKTFATSNSAFGTKTISAGDTEYIYYASPSSFGTPSWTDGAGIYTFDKMKSFDFTNESGYVENYTVWRASDAPGLKNQKIIIS